MSRKISLVTGLYLFAFILCHLINLAVGLVSVQAMMDTAKWLMRPWTNPVGGGLMFVSLLLHIAMGMRALYLRNTLRLSYFDGSQLLLGLSIPVLLFPHIITMSMLPPLTGAQASYAEILQHFWIAEPMLGLRQVIGLVVVWLHSCMGLFVWLRMQPFWSRVAFAVYPTLVLLPALALLGFVEGGKQVIADYQAPVQASQIVDDKGHGNSEVDSVLDGASMSDQSETSDASQVSNVYEAGANQTASATMSMRAANEIIGRVTMYGVLGYLVLLLVTLLARAVRRWRQSGQVQVVHADIGVLHAPAGSTLLEVSRLNDVSHASLCGGKGRCATCQVRVLDGADALTPRAPLEQRRLVQIGAADNIRLACQARTSAGMVKVERVMPEYVQAHDIPRRQPTTEPRQPLVPSEAKL